MGVDYQPILVALQVDSLYCIHLPIGLFLHLDCFFV